MKRKEIYSNKHNEYRTNFLSYDVTPEIAALNIQSSNMEKMYWDDDLAQVAEDYARECKFLNRSPFSYGESMAGISGFRSTYVITKNTLETLIMYRYGKRRQRIDLPEQDIINFKQNETPIEWRNGTSSFSQLVWATSSKIGCGWAYCDYTDRRGTVKQRKVEICEYLSARLDGVDWFKIGDPCTACAD